MTTVFLYFIFIFSNGTHVMVKGASYPSSAACLTAAQTCNTNPNSCITPPPNMTSVNFACLQ